MVGGADELDIERPRLAEGSPWANAGGAGTSEIERPRLAEGSPWPRWWSRPRVGGSAQRLRTQCACRVRSNPVVIRSAGAAAERAPAGFVTGPWAYFLFARRCQRVRFSIFLCFFFRMRLRRFLISDPMAGGNPSGRIDRPRQWRVPGDPAGDPWARRGRRWA